MEGTDECRQMTIRLNVPGQLSQKSYNVLPFELELESSHITFIKLEVLVHNKTKNV